MVRIVCGFVDDIYKTIDVIKAIPSVSIYNEKDYILNAKPNGYRSYHLILEIETEFPDVLGNEKGTYFNGHHNIHDHHLIGILCS